MYAEVLDYSNYSPGVSISEGLLHMAANNGVETILDAGCGRGQLVNIFLNKGYKAKGVDLTLGGIYGNFDRNIFHEAPLSVLPFDDDSFDMVVSVDVLEHIPQGDNLLDDSIKELARVCRGFVMIQVCLSSDTYGKRIGETLHETVKPKEWWQKTLSKHFNEVILLDELGTNALFYGV